MANLAYLLNSHLSSHSRRRTEKQQDKILVCVEDLRNILDDIEHGVNEDTRRAQYDQ